MNLWRSRWAAIGAAIAVTLGAGGLFAVQAAGEASAFVAITPTRVLDTRAATNIALSGPFSNGVSRKLQVTGTIPTDQGNQLVVPAGATAVVFNVTVIAPTHRGFVSVRPGSASGTPTTSSINFAAGQTVGNGGTVAVPTSGTGVGTLDIFYRGSDPGATTDIVLDLAGYYAAGSGGGGFSDVTYLTDTFPVPAIGETGEYGQTTTPACPAGQSAIAAGVNPNWPSPPFDPGPETFVQASYPDPALQYRRWVIVYSNVAIAEGFDATLYTVCAAAAP